MDNLLPIYTLGDIVVHRNYGVGKIEAVESKPLNGENVECFKVKTENSVFWFPTNSAENPRIHPVASQKRIQKAIDILRNAPNSLEIDPLEWKQRIDDVQTSGDFLDISSLVRDLSILKTTKKLNRTQEQALNNLEDRLLREWAASLDVEIKSIRPIFQTYLKETKDDYKEEA